jgi:hypothetical protein
MSGSHLCCDAEPRVGAVLPVFFINTHFDIKKINIICDQI